MDQVRYKHRVPSVPAWKTPSGRGGATTIAVDNKIVLFGGHFFVAAEKFEYLNETWVFDIEKEIWQKINCTGDIPLPRYGHSAHLFGSRMFIFDLIEWCWSEVSTVSHGPCGRLFHAAEQVGRKLVIHGGWDGITSFDDLFIFNTDSFVWSCPKTTGFAPSSRYGHSLTLTSDGKLIIFGGCSLVTEASIPKYNNDVRQLNTESMVWSLVSVNGAKPTPRCGHTSALVNDAKHLAVFGGWGQGGLQTRTDTTTVTTAAHSLHLLDLASNTWGIPMSTQRTPPKHTYYHACCMNGPVMACIGGFDGRQAGNTIELFEFEQDAATAEREQH